MENGYKIQKLHGSKNFDTWKLLVQSALAEKGLVPDDGSTGELYYARNPRDAMKALGLVRLSLGPGPLVNTKHCTTVFEIWTTLERLYAPKGFSADFLICKDLFSTTIERASGSIETYLTRIKRLTEELSARNLAIPNRVIAAYTLFNLSSEYSHVVSAISQSYRGSDDEIDIDLLFGQLLDESRRLKAYEVPEKHNPDTDMTMFTKNSPKPRKTPTCYACGEIGHKRPDCPNRTKPRKASSGIKTPKSDAIYATEAEDDVTLMIADLSEPDQLLYAKNEPKNNWILDSGATRHICSDYTLFTETRDCNRIFSWGNAGSITLKKVGSVKVRFADTQRQATISNVFYAPDIGVNLLSLGTLLQKGYSVNAKGQKTNIIDPFGRKLTCGMQNGNNLTYITANPLSDKLHFTEAKPNAETIHARMGHIGQKALAKLCKAAEVKYDKFTCNICLESNARHEISRAKPHKASVYLEKVNSDICGPIKPETLGKKRHFVTFLDDSTRYIEIDLLRHRSDLKDAYTKWESRAERQSTNKVLRLHSDNAREYKYGELANYIAQKGIVATFSAPYTPAQNGKAERMNLTLMNRVRAWLNASNLPRYLWGEALYAAAYVYNRTPHSALEGYISPYQARFRLAPDIRSIYVWGSAAWAVQAPQNLEKLDNRSKLGYIIGFGSNQVKIHFPEQRYSAWYRTGDTKIRENVFRKDINDLSDVLIDETEPVDHAISEPVDQNDRSTYELTSAEPVDQTNEMPKTTSYNDFLSQLGQAASEDYIFSVSDDRRTYHEAISGANGEKWSKSMQKHISDLTDLKAYKLTPLPPNRKAIRGKWVLKVKEPIGEEPIYKSRWVLKGFQQKPGIDFTETYASTLNPIGYRFLLLYGAFHDYEINVWDVTNAYPNADISEELYAEQPLGYVDQSYPDHVWRVLKAINGLKQSARAWQGLLRHLLSKNGLVPSRVDPNLFISAKNGDFIAIGAYVDDLLVIGQNKQTITNLFTSLNKTLLVKDLGPAKTFLGVDIARNRKTRQIYLSQKRYFLDILARFGYSVTDGPTHVPNIDPTMSRYPDIAAADDIHYYQQQIGCLMYAATKTRPDLAWTTCFLARFMANPGPEQQLSIRKLWKYLSSTIDLGLLSEKPPPVPPGTSNIVGYSDSDYGGDSDSRRSTTAYLFTLFGLALAWHSGLQKTVALSSCEAEYMAYTEAIKEQIYIRQIISEFTTTITAKLLLSDSKSAIDLLYNRQYHARSKHIDIRYHFIREYTEKGSTEVRAIGGKDNPADALTKPANRSNFDLLIAKSGLVRAPEWATDL